MSKINFEKLKTDFVGKRKIWFIIPGAIVVVALILGVIYGFAFGSPANLSMDFTGGYSLTVTLGDSLTDETSADYQERIGTIFEELSNDAGSPYGLEVSTFTRQGSGSDAGFNVSYRAVADDMQMITINEELQEALRDGLFANDIYAGVVTMGDSVSGSVSSELIINAVCAVLLAVVLMLIYIAIRFELLSGITSIICLCHDMLMMVAFMIIFQVPISSTFIAALITILGYSINNTIIIFDRIRDINKSPDAPYMLPSDIANNAIKSTMMRSINTTWTTFITIFMVCVMSIAFFVSDMIFFCLPLIIGLVAGTFSSVLLAPSIWSMWKDHENKRLSGTKTSAPVERGAETAPVAGTEI